MHKNATSCIEQILGASSTKQQLYGHQLPISKTVHIRQTWHVGHCWSTKDELISNVLLYTSSHGRASGARRPARTYLQQLSANTGFSREDLPGVMDDRDGWRVRVGKSMVAVCHDDDDIYYLKAKFVYIFYWLRHSFILYISFFFYSCFF